MLRPGAAGTRGGRSRTHSGSGHHGLAGAYGTAVNGLAGNRRAGRFRNARTRCRRCRRHYRPGRSEFGGQVRARRYYGTGHGLARKRAALWTGRRCNRHSGRGALTLGPWALRHRGPRREGRSRRGRARTRALRAWRHRLAWSGENLSWLGRRHAGRHGPGSRGGGPAGRDDGCGRHGRRRARGGRRHHGRTGRRGTRGRRGCSRWSGRRGRRCRRLRNRFRTRPRQVSHWGMNRTAAGQGRTDGSNRPRMTDSRPLRLGGNRLDLGRRSGRRFGVPRRRCRLPYRSDALFLVPILLRRGFRLRRQIGNIESVQAAQPDSYVFID